MNPFPIAFPAQSCAVCGEPVEVEDGVGVYAEGKPIGIRHDECEPEVES